MKTETKDDGTREYKGYEYRIVKSIIRSGKEYYCIHEPYLKSIWFGLLGKEKCWKEWKTGSFKTTLRGHSYRQYTYHRKDCPKKIETDYLAELDRRYKIDTFVDEIIK